MNKIIIIGNVVRDPELNVTQNGKKLCKLTVAVGRAFDKEKTDFLDAPPGNRKPNLIAKYVKKGKPNRNSRAHGNKRNGKGRSENPAS